MTSGGVLALLFLLAGGGVSIATLVITGRGGRGPVDPPASRPRIDPGGFPVLDAPRGVLGRRPAQRRRASRLSAASAAAAVHTARESRTARAMSARPGG